MRMWCSHCDAFCRVRRDRGFTSCEMCGKVLCDDSEETRNMKWCESCGAVRRVYVLRECCDICGKAIFDETKMFNYLEDRRIIRDKSDEKHQVDSVSSSDDDASLTE